jgi:hypothetical protein
MAQNAKCVQVIRNDYTSTSVTTSAYVQLDAALDQDVRSIEVFDSSGSVLKLALGASGSEVDIPFHIVPGGTTVPVAFIAARGDRLSIRAVDASATTGQLVINLYA